MPTTDVRNAAHRLIDRLPMEATWDDAIYKMAVRREIEAGLADSDAGRTQSVEAVMRSFGIDGRPRLRRDVDMLG